MELRGACAIVTGASGGIGAALVAELLAAGCDVLAIARDSARLRALDSGTANGGELSWLACDITGADACADVLEAARAARRRPNLLIHAAALSEFGLFADLPMARAEQLLATNVLAPMALTQALLPLLRSQTDASVVAIGSTFGSIGFPGFAAYSASKFALRGLFEALAREHADGPVRFCYLSPRATCTPMNSAAVDALNRELGTAVDSASAVATRIVAALRGDRRRQQFGWPEKLFARLNGLLPGLVDRALRAQLPIVRRHAHAPRSDVSSPSALIVQELQS